MEETQSFHFTLNGVTVTKLFRFSLELKSIRQGTETTVELSVRRLATRPGQGGVVQWWRDGSRNDRGEGGLLIDLRQVVIGRPGCQLHLLIGDPIRYGGFRLICWLETSGHESSGYPRRPPRTSCSKPGLGRRPGRSPDDGGGRGWCRSGAGAETLASANATTPQDDHERHDEGGPGDVKCPAGHGGA